MTSSVGKVGSDRHGGVGPIIALLLASVGTQTAVHVILPALPAMQEVFGLSDSAISWVTTAFVAPGVILVVPLGVLADRIGRRRVLVGSQLIFGLAGFVLLWAHSLGLLLGLRLIQGAATAAILALSISLIADIRSGSAQVAAQSYRVIAMAVGGGIFPVVGALMLNLSWYAPFALQILAIPIALYGWRVIPEDQSLRRRRVAIGDVLRASHTVEGWAVLYSGFIRFFMKTAYLSYLPIMLIGERGLSPTFTGIVLGITATSGVIAATLTPRLVPMISAVGVLAVGLGGIGISLGLLGLGTAASSAIVASILYGAADAWFGVIQNVMITKTVPAHMRTSFVGAALAIRNLGKLAAPLGIALIVIWVQVSDAFLFASVLAIVSLGALVPLKAVSEKGFDKEGEFPIEESL